MKTVPAIVGPTGIGKTEIGIQVARALDLEIISADSRQIYKFMDIGTAKPPKTEFPNVHMIDIVFPDQVYSAGDYGRDGRALIDQLARAHRRVLVVGGSGLYLSALFYPLADLPGDPEVREKLKKEPQPVLYERLSTIDPGSAARIHPNDHQRTARALEVYELTGISLSAQLRNRPESGILPCCIGLDLPRAELYRRIEHRFDMMLETGFLDEIKNLKARGYTGDLYAFNALGYRQMFDHLEGKLSFEEAVRQAKQKTKEYAKRQLTWFRNTEGIRWIEHQEPDATVKKVIELVSDCVKITQQTD